MNGPSVVAAPVDAVDATEEWFLRRGIPHFIHDYSATEDVFTRTLPVLTLLFVAEVVGALNRAWPLWLNVVAGCGGLAILGGLWAGANRLRGRRPLARPHDVGPFEVAVFVLGPPLLPLVFGGQVRSAAGIAALNLALLGLVYLITSYGLVPMTRWAVRRLVGQVRHLVGLVVRALPLLLLFVTFLFINAEVWEVASGLTGPWFWVAIGTFVVIGGVFLVTRLPQDVGDLARFDSVEQLRGLVAGTPAAVLVGVDGTDAPPLGGRERGNVALLLLYAQGLQIALVSLLIGVFFVLFGMVAVAPGTIEGWTGGPADVLVSAVVWDRPLVVSEQLLRVATFLAGFSGLYFAVYMVTDEVYRREFRDETLDELREALAVRAAYLHAVRNGDAAAGGTA